MRDDLTPPRWSYAAAALLAVGALVCALVRLPDHRPLVLAAAVGFAVACALPGWLFRRKGYTFTEGWFNGLLIWPLAVAFGIFGPRSN